MDQFLRLVSRTSFLEIWLTRVSLSLSPSPSPSLSFSSCIPIWSQKAHHIYLLALASKIHRKGA